MLFNFFKTSVRNISRHASYAAINIAGLAVGLATAIFIFLWVYDELNYDNFHEHGATLYKVMHHSYYSDGTIETAHSTPAPLADAIRAEIPEVEYAVRTDWGGQLLFDNNQVSFLEQGLWADKGFLNMFTYPLILGNKATPIPDESSVAISRKLADKYFPGQSALGKIIKIGEKYDMKVTAVFEDTPDNSSVRFDFILPFEKHYKERAWMKQWGNSSNQLYVKLHDNASPTQVDAKMNELIKKNCADCVVSPFLHPYTDLRLYNNYTNAKQDGGRIEYVRAFAIVAVFILLIACINFMNLATARSATRSREVGVRKVIGAQRSALIVQFIAESILLSFIGLVLAVTIVEILIPFFNLLTEKSVVLDLSKPAVILSLLGITIVTGVLAGSYPALFLSSFKPATVLKGSTHSLMTGAGLRKTLVVFQFTIAIVLVSGSILVNRQIDFIKNKNLGFNRFNVITMNIRGGVEKNIAAFKTEALRHPGVISVSTAGHNPFDVQNSTTDPIWPGKQEGQNIAFRAITSDADFIKTMGMNLVDGRNFSGQRADTINYIVNETAVKAMGLDNPVGTDLEMWYGKGKIIGVVQDFHNRDFKSQIDPLIFAFYPENSWRIFVRLDGANMKGALAHLEKTYKRFDEVYPFEYSFLDKQFDDQYQSENTTANLAICFMVIAIFISCLGLFGLASFMAERRTKEIGIRKALGASVPGIVSMLCTDFTKLIVIALGIGCPIAYYLMDLFLQRYQFKTTLDISVFVITGICILVIALATVVYQSTKAAIVNPVESLRSE